MKRGPVPCSASINDFINNAIKNELKKVAGILTMEQTKSASEVLALIERKYFRGAGLDKASRTEGDERRAYRLEQVERLLTKENAGALWAMYLSDEFWTADEGRNPISEDNLLMTLAGQRTLTDREMARLRLILEIAGLCHDLALHFTFDLNEAFGIKSNNMLGYSDFGVSNKQLVEWLTTTAYEQIAMHTAYIMKKEAICVYEFGHYLPAQDGLAELFSSEYGQLIRSPQYTKIPPRRYVSIILDAMLAIKRHWQRGRRLKLRPDLVMLHDEIYGVVPRQFDKGVLQAAQELYDYMDKELCGRFVTKDFKPWDEQPESFKQFVSDQLERFADKVREVRSKYLAEGWVRDDSLEFAYLMEHAQRCGDGWWREEDDAL